MNLTEIQYYSGKILKIIFAMTSNNKMPAKDYFELIRPPDWGKLDRILRRLGDHGRIKNKEQFRSVNDGLFEVKGGKFRLVGYFLPGMFILTHGFEKRGGGKKANKFPDKERKKALEIKSNFKLK